MPITEITGSIVKDGSILSVDIGTGAVTTTNILDGTIQAVDVDSTQIVILNPAAAQGGYLSLDTARPYRGSAAATTNGFQLGVYPGSTVDHYLHLSRLSGGNAYADLAAGIINASTGFRLTDAGASGTYLRGNGTNYVSSTIQVADVPTLNQDSTGTSAYLTATDHRGISPSAFPPSRLRFGLNWWTNDSGSSTFADFLNLESYGDGTAGASNLININKSDFGIRMFQKAWTNSSTQASTPYTVYRDVVFGANAVAANYVPKITRNALGIEVGNSLIYDDGTNVGIGTAGPNFKLDISGTLNATGAATFGSTLGVSGAINGQTISAAASFTGTLSVATGYKISGASAAAGHYLRGNGTNYVDSTIQAADISPFVAGTANYVSKFSSANVLGNSLIYDDGTHVGIGTTSPNFKLHLSDSGANAVLIQFTNASSTSYAWSSGAYLGIDGATKDFYFNQRETANIIFTVSGGTEAMRIASNTRVGINVVSPNYLLDVGGTFHVSGTSVLSGSVGIGPTNPLAKLDILGSSTAAGGPSSTNKGVLQVATETNVGLAIGTYTSTPYAAWIQAQDSRSGVVGQYPISLNPLGGHIGIGVVNPVQKLDIASGSLNYTFVASAVPPTLVKIVGGGNLSAGDYKYVVSYVNPSGETQAIQISSAITVSGGDRVTATIPVSPDLTVTARKLYRTQVNGTTAYTLVTTISDNTTTTYTDGASDASIAGNAKAVPYNTTAGCIFTEGVRVAYLGGQSIAESLISNRNLFIGYKCGIQIGGDFYAANGYQNTGVGHNAMSLTTTGSNNVAIGVQSLDANISGRLNTAVGYAALNCNVTGIRNVGIGCYAGGSTGGPVFNQVQGYTDSIFIGYNATADNASSSRTNVIALGAYTLATASNQLVIPGVADETITMSQQTTANTAGFGLTIKASDAPGTIGIVDCTDKGGGPLILTPGIGTGAAMGKAGGYVSIKGNVVGATGTVNQIQVDRAMIPAGFDLTNNAVNVIYKVTCPTGKLGGGSIFYSVVANNGGTGFQVATARVDWSIYNLSGTANTVILDSGLSSNFTGGTLTRAWTAVDVGAGVVELRFQPNSSLAGLNYLRIHSTFINNSDLAFVAA